HATRMIFSPRRTAVVVNQFVAHAQRSLAEFSDVATVVASTTSSFHSVRNPHCLCILVVPVRHLLPMKPVTAKHEFYERATGCRVRVISAAVPNLQSAQPQRAIAPRRRGVIFVPRQISVPGSSGRNQIDSLQTTGI